MKLATRMAASLALLAVLLIGTNIYQLRLVEKIHSVGRELGAVKLDAASLSIRLLQGIEGLREFAAKSLLLGDQDYLQQWATWERAVWSDLNAMDALSLSGQEARRRTALLLAWESYESIFAPPLASRDATARPGPRGPVGLIEPSLLGSLDAALDSIRSATEALIVQNDAVVEQRVQESVLAVDRARRAAWLASGGSLALAVLLSLALFVTTSGPLRRLYQGTREIAGGNLDHRIEAHGGGELAELARDFNEMAQKLSQVDALKKDFLSHVSHELKGPLAAIQETNLILLDRIPGPLTEKQAHLLELSQQSADRLSTMITNLLGLSRLDGALKYHFETHDVAEITSEVLAELSPLGREKGLHVHLEREGPALLSCDADRLREVIANLVGNAFKFSPTGGPVLVSLRSVASPPESAPALRGSVEDRGSPYLLLAIEDRGPGVPDAHKQGIFERFHQVHPRTRMRGQGVGLGLAIARKIVNAHGGAIWVEDGEQGGSRFYALFPGAPPQAGTREEATPSRRSRPSRAQTLGASVVLLLLPLLGACGTAARTPDPAGPSHTTAVAAVAPAYPVASARIAIRLSMTAILEHADELLAEESFDEAAAAYQEVLDRHGASDWDASGAVRARALWGLALTQILPGGSETPGAPAMGLLRTLSTSFSGTQQSSQANWVVEVLEELSRLREDKLRQEQRIRHLNETVEQLKRIDLTRRPATGPGERRSKP
jgi:signal transduction histidine kinase